MTKATNDVVREIMSSLRCSAGAARNIESAARDYLRTPEGGWPETQQAWSRLTDATLTWHEVRGLPDQVGVRAAGERARRALAILRASGAETHSGRRAAGEVRS